MTLSENPASRESLLWKEADMAFELGIYIIIVFFPVHFFFGGGLMGVILTGDWIFLGMQCSIKMQQVWFGI